MNPHVDQITETLLTPNDLDLEKLSQTLSIMAVGSVDYADLYFEKSETEMWSLEDGNVKEASFHQDSGAGARSVSGEKQGFSYTNELSVQRLAEACLGAKKIQTKKTINKILPLRSQRVSDRYSDVNPLFERNSEQKIQFLKQLDSLTRARDERISEVQASLAVQHKEILVLASDGTLEADIRPLVRLSLSVQVCKDGRRERGSSGLGGRYSLNIALTEKNQKWLVDKAVSQALINLKSVSAPAGEMTVVLGSGWPGVLLHEAVGHGLEGDFNRKGTSFYSGKIGEKVAAKGVTVVDDGTFNDRRGSLSVDDEGVRTQRNVLIEDGVLVNYLQDKMNARLMNVPPTGNGRRESYAHLPMPRMTNTFMEEGQYSQEEMIESVSRGLFAVNFGGGQVDIISGQFVFEASEAYLIEKGKITRPVKGAMLVGHGPSVMQAISMVGNDFSLDSGVGTCGKNGQSVPVGVGQPSLKINNLTVGGTS